MRAPSRIQVALGLAMLAVGPLVASLLERLGGRLAHLESREIDWTVAVLVLLTPALSPLLGLRAVELGEGSPLRPLRVLARTLVLGAGLGMAAAFGVTLVALRSSGQGSATLGPSALGYLGFGALAGLAVALPLALALLGLAALLRRFPERAMLLTAVVVAVVMPAAMALILTRPREAPKDATLATRPPPEPGKTRGAGPAEESPEQKRRRQVAGLLNEVADHCRSDRAAELEKLVLEADKLELLGDLFRAMVDEGLYDAAEEELRALPDKSPALSALIEARPGYGAETLNADTVRSIREHKEHDNAPFSVIIVPGYTPLKARKPLAVDEIDAAVKRLEAAVADLKHGLAPYILVSGGSVHPAGTPHNEALSMRDWLLRHGVEADRILVDPFARHSTTNLRNAGRMMLELGLKKALIVTGFEASPFSQAFYFAHPFMSSFETRSRRELGYTVGKLEGLDDHHIAFVPSAEVTRINPHDPLDW